MDDLQFDYLKFKANDIGQEHGRNAASWAFDGNTSQETYEYFLKGIREGDPEVYDKMPHADLSGEWSGSYDSDDLMTDLGIGDEDEAGDDITLYLCYDEGFSIAVEQEIERMCIEALTSLYRERFEQLVFTVCHDLETGRIWSADEAAVLIMDELSNLAP